MTRCKMHEYVPSCLSCRMNVLLGELDDLKDLIKWEKKK